MENRNAKGHSQIEKQLKEIDGISDFNSVVSTLAKLHNQGVGGLFGIYVGQDMKDIEKNQYHIYQSGIGLPNMEYYTSDKKRDILNAYELYVQKSHHAIYKHENKAQIFADNIIRFETALAKTMFKPAEMRIPKIPTTKKQGLKFQQWYILLTLTYISRKGSLINLILPLLGRLNLWKTSP